MNYKHLCFSFLSLLSVSVRAMEESSLQKLAILHNENGYSIVTPDKIVPVHSYDVDKEIRNISSENLAKLLAADTYLKVDKMSDVEEYTIKLMGRVRGGGVAGAAIGFWVGRVGTYAVFGTGILIASALTGPAAPATFYALAGSLAPVVASTAEVVALGGGMVGAVATGPV